MKAGSGLSALGSRIRLVWITLHRNLDTNSQSLEQSPEPMFVPSEF